MLPDVTLPVSLAGLLLALRPCFTRRSFETFCALTAGLAGQPQRRTVCGMLLGAGLARAWPHDRAHRFFARARWDIDELGLSVARLAVLLLVPPDAPVTVAADDSVFRRSGRQVHGAGWQHDGSAPSRNKISFGTCFVTCGIVVTLPFCTRPVCLPVLARLNIPAKNPRRRRRDPQPDSKVSQATALVTLLAGAFPGRTVHVVADAYYHGSQINGLPPAVTWTCRLMANAALYGLPPRRRPGTRGRPGCAASAWASPRTWPPPRTGPPPSSAPTARTSPSSWPRSPACGTAACTPAPSGSSPPATTTATSPWSPPTWPAPPQT